MSFFITAILTILVFGIVIFVHELGHFIVAKWCGIKVNEFSMGMGPKIFGFVRGETAYNVRLLPIGGYVDMEGENNTSDDERSFNKKPVYKRMFVILAGATMNLILGFLLLISVNSTQSKIVTNTIAQFKENAVSNSTGLQVNDQILKINGSSIFTENDILYKLLRDKDGIVDIIVKRDGKELTLNNVTFNMISDSNGVKSTEIDFLLNTEPKSFFNVLKSSFFKTISMGRLVWLSIGDLISGNASVSDLSGPIGVAGAIGQSYSMGLTSFFTMFAFITINIGLFNLLPIPALDGGRFIFLIIESIRRKPIKQKVENYIHTIGFLLLILLIIFVTFNDVFKLFR